MRWWCSSAPATTTASIRTQMAAMAHDTFDLARRIAPSSKLLVIGPPWPTADPPFDVLYVRDILSGQAHDAGATFIDPISEGWFVGQARPDRPRRRAPQRRRTCVHGGENRSADPCPVVQAQLIVARIQRVSLTLVPGTSGCTGREWGICG